MLLSEKNPHPHDKQVVFHEGPHEYVVKKRKGYTSVTTFVHSQFYPFNPNYVIDRMMKSPNWPESEYFGMTKEEIKSQWKKNGNDAAVAGTKMHADIEHYYNGDPRENDSIEYKYFMDFEKKNTLTPYRTEWVIYDEELLFGGSIDMVYIKTDGTLAIYDWKRCKEIKKNNTWNKFSKNKLIKHIPDTNYWHYSLQLNIYKAIIEKNYNMKVSELCLICLHPDNFNQSYLKYDVGDMSSVIDILFEERKKTLNKKEI
tara:strand:- start:2158 stop:2928 length:771 start_codon:yes stop_codon:yes gene_type:complete